MYFQLHNFSSSDLSPHLEKCNILFPVVNTIDNIKTYFALKFFNPILVIVVRSEVEYDVFFYVAYLVKTCNAQSEQPSQEASSG